MHYSIDKGARRNYGGMLTGGLFLAVLGVLVGAYLGIRFAESKIQPRDNEAVLYSIQVDHSRDLDVYKALETGGLELTTPYHRFFEDGTVEDL